MRIQCPSCRQRFNATEELMGKTVECGSCDQRFVVEHDTVVAEKVKNYPGEKEVGDLHKYASKPTVPSATNFSQVHYADNVNMAKLEPLKPRRFLAILVAVLAYIIVLAVFLFTGVQGGMLRDLVTYDRFVLCGFIALLAGGLLIYGMKKNRKFSVLLAVVIGAILVFLPVLYPGSPIAESSGEFKNKPVSIEGEDSLLNNPQNTERLYKQEIGYGPIETALDENSAPEVIGIYLRGASQLLCSKISISFYEATDEVDRGILYDRGEDGLLVFIGQTKSFEELVTICKKFGEIKKISESLRVIDLMVSEAKLITKSATAALDPLNQDFQRQNLLALRSIDPMERLYAIRRLGDSEPVALRHDVVKKLIEMLPVSNTEHQLAIIKTLKKWSKPDEGAEPVVLATVQEIFEKGELDVTSVEFLIERKVEGGALILMELWNKDPVTWSGLFTQLGGDAEQLLLPMLPTMDAVQFSSACHILEKVGTPACLDALEKVLLTRDEQSAKTLQATIDEIQNRL